MAAETAVLGLDCKLYRNTGTYGSPTWVLIENVKDVTLSLTKSSADVTTRNNGGWRAEIGALKEGSIEFDSVWDTTDADFAVILAAWVANTTVEFLVLDGLLATAGSQGLRASCQVMECTRTEPLEEAVMAKVVLKPTISANAPEWYTAS